VWWVREPLDLARMKQATAPFVGFRDFQSFADADEGQDKSTTVLVDRLDIVEAGDLVLVGIVGSHFLWKMVRRIVGVLAEIGRGGLEPSAAASFLRESSSAPARLTAPPSGLFLERVWYGGDRREESFGPITLLAAPRGR
jgi:tRNA pseudouridine38-40 synthase